MYRFCIDCGSLSCILSLVENSFRERGWYVTMENIFLLLTCFWENNRFDFVIFHAFKHFTLHLPQDADELHEIDERLRKDGFKTDITAEHKLRYLWRQLSRSETSLASSFETVEELRKQHSQEMIEVETYVEHIRQLSSEREALTLELEVENEKLKADLDDMKNDQELNMLGIVDVIALLKESNVNFEHVQNKLDMKDCLLNVVRQCNQALDRVRFLELENGNLKMAGKLLCCSFYRNILER